MKKTVFPQHGYIALMSAIVICALLLALTVSLGASAFFESQSNIDRQSKKESSNLAEACVNAAILESANHRYSTNETINVDGQNTCQIISSKNNTPVGGQATIQTQAVENHAYTNLQAIITTTTFSIISLQECPTLSLCS